MFNKGSMWLVGRDSNQSFWFGNWIKGGPIRHRILGPLPHEAELLEVKDVLSVSGWNWDRIPFVLPVEIKNLIQATPVSITSRGADRLVWAGSTRGDFDVKSAYNLVDNSNLVPALSMGWIWKLNTLPRVKTFIWRCMHDSIGVKGCLVRRGFGNDDLCPICQEDRESILHALRDCTRVRAIWLQLGVSYINQSFWGNNLQEWLNVNGSRGSRVMYGRNHWSTLFSFAVWMFWKSRNQAVFTGKAQSPKLYYEIENMCTEFMYCVSSPRCPVQRVVVTCRWEKPLEGWIKLNTDGCALGSMGLAGCGGVVRDSHGEWISGFSRHIGTTNSFVAELWGLRDGLFMCSNLNIPFLIVEMDAKSIVEIFCKSGYVNDVISPILDDCRMLITKLQQVQFRHCFRQSNQCADALARLGANQDLDFRIFDSPPVDVSVFFEQDTIGLGSNRLCPASVVLS